MKSVSILILFVILISHLSFVGDIKAQNKETDIIRSSEYSHFSNQIKDNRISLLYIDTDSNKDTFEEIKIQHKTKQKFKGKLPDKTFGMILKETLYTQDIDTLMVKNTTYIDSEGSQKTFSSYWVLGSQIFQTSQYDDRNNNLIKKSSGVNKNNEFEVTEEVFRILKDYNIFPLTEKRDTVTTTLDDSLDYMFRL